MSNDSHRMAWRYAVLAALAHAMFITVALVPRWRAEPVVSGDAMSYLVPGQNLQHYGKFSRESAPPFRWEPYRTPGYPLAIAGTIALFHDSRFVLYLSVLTAGLGGFCASALAGEWAGAKAARIAGIMAAILPNSLGLSAMMLTDALAGHLTLVWVWQLYMAFTRRSWKWLGSSVLTLLVLQSLKPTFAMAGLLAVLLAAGYRDARRRWLMAATIVLFAIPMPLLFAQRNLRDHGSFALTLLGAETARDYLQARAVAKATGRPYEEAVTQLRRDDRLAAQNLVTPESYDGRLYAVRRAAVTDFMMHQPAVAATLMVTEMLQQLFAPQEFALRVFWEPVPAFARVLGSLLTIVLFVGAAIGTLRMANNGFGPPAWLAWSGLLFFLLAGSISHYVGARLRFPADMVMIPVASVGLSSLKRRPDGV